MFKNVANQKLIVFAFDATTGLPKTGDAANIVAYVSKDYGAVTVLTDTGTGGASEMDATNAKGYYIFDLTQGETNADFLLFSGKSSTTNIVVVGAPAAVFTLPPNFTKTVIDTAGLIDANAVKIGPTGAGTAQTARDIGASVLLSTGTGTGQLDFTSGVVKANVTQLLGTAWLTPGVAGTPDVNAKLHGGTSQTGRDIGASVLLSSGTSTGQISLSAGLVTLAGVTHTGAMIPTVTTVTNQLTAAQIATGVWQDATAGDFTVSSSIGKSLYTSGVVPGGTNGLFIAGTNATTTITTGLTTHFIGTLDTVTTVTNQLTAAAIATGVWQDATAGDFTTANSIGKSLYNSFTAGTSVFTVAALANAPVTAAGPSAATIATAVWTDTTASDFTTALSIGKSVMNGVTLGTGLTVARVTLTDTLTTYTGNTVQTGDSFARIGATGSGLTSLAPSSTALSTAQWTNTLATNLGTTNTTVASNLDLPISGRMATYTQPVGFLAANFTTGIPISGDLSATMKTSVTTAATAATPVVTISGAISTLSALNTSLSSVHGTGSWATATGFSTLVATDIVSNGAITTASGAVSSVTNVTQLGGSNVVHTAGKLWVLDSSGNAVAPASATTAIQAKTDNLPSDPADESLIIAATDAIMGRLGAPAGASVSADIADLPTNAELATALGTSDDSTLAAVEVLRKLLRADHYIDTGTTPWALVYMQEGTGGIGVGVELFRKRLASVTGTNLVSTDTVVGQAKT